MLSWVGSNQPMKMRATSRGQDKKPGDKNKLNRVTMASRMITQAVPITGREAPLVQVKDKNGKSVEQNMALDYLLAKAPEDGVVKDVTDTYIQVNKTKVDIYHNFPMNQKSVSGTTRVNILKADGTLWRGEIKDYEYCAGDMVQSIHPRTKQSAWMPINGFLKHKNDKKLYEVKYNSGRSVVVTEDHSLITLGDDGEMTAVYPDSCVPGTTRSPIAMLPPHDMSSHSYDFGCLVGLYLSQGSLDTRDNLVVIASHDERRVDQIYNLVSTLGYSARIDKSKGVAIKDRGLYSWLDTNCGHYSGNKFIASELFQYGGLFKQGLVAGYFTDGYVRKDKNSAFELSVSTTSKRLVDDIADLLSLLGIVSATRYGYNENIPNHSRIYILRVPKPAALKLQRWFFYDDMQLRYEDAVSGGVKLTTLDGIPVTKDARKVLKAGFEVVPDFVRKNIHLGYVSRRHLVNNTGIFGEWANSDVMWDVITAIEEVPYEEYVYDFEVDESNVFAVNSGLIVHNTFLHMNPVVKVGDIVKKGQPLVDTNFTKGHALALGTNLRVGYVPYHSFTHEDSCVVSESTAKRLTSEHMYTKSLELSPDIVVDKHRFVSMFPLKINSSQMAKLDEDGVVKKGQILERGDYAVTALAKRDMTNSDQILMKMHASLANPYKDVSVVWDHDRPGVVVDVVRQGALIKIVFKTEDETRVGDKLTGRYGNKGTVGLILPDHEMPHDREGKPLDIMLNPASVISRVNPGQLYDTMASLIAEKTGKPYLAENFDKEDSSKKVIRELKQHGINPETEIYDPKTKKLLGKVLVGKQYMLKLHKQTEGNFAARSTKSYDVNMQPSKGGEEGAKAVGLQEVYALLAHNARENLHEMAAYKSQKNEEFWDAVKLGLPTPVAKEPFAFEKFKALVGGAGINVTKNGSKYAIMPVTDKQIVAQSSGKIEAPTMLKGDTKKWIPEKGGIFDEVTTGGLNGRNWTHVDLAEPIVNPMFDKVVKTLLGDKWHAELTPAQMKAELAKIDVTKRIAAIRAALPKMSATNRDKVTKELRYLMALQKAGMKPEEYVLTKFPIVPPTYRPIYPGINDGAPMVSDLNHLYRDLININNTMKEMKHFPDEEKKDLRASLQQAAGAVVGVTEPINTKSKKQELKGVVPTITGVTAKEGYFHRKLLYRPQDATGRGTILPDPTLHVDEAKIPKEMAIQLFKPFVIKNLVTKGYTPVMAAKEVSEHSNVADVALHEEMAKRPIILNRAPTLHKFNMLAFKPIAVEGKSIFIPPLVIKGYGADFDGDSIHGDSWVLVRDKEYGKIELKQIKDV